MKYKLNTSVLGLALICLVPGIFTASAQTSNVGSVSVAVLDPAGATVPGAQLQLRDTETNDIRKAETQANGTYSFPNLSFGIYQLTVTKPGFETEVFQSVQVQTARVTTVNVVLKVGGTTQTVTVTEAASPLLETDSSTLSDTLDTKQVANLPVSGRNIMSLAFLVPGWSSTGGVGSVIGTWDNLPGGAVVSADFDGTPGISNRFRSGGFQYGTTAVQPRIEDVAEMTTQTAQVDLGGIGTSAMRISIVTRRGTNAFHGRLYEDFRNHVLNANSWINNARNQPRNILKLNDFGGSVGGPILKNKLFFFDTWAESIQPFSGNLNAVVLSPAAQQGLFSYKDASGALQTINLLQVAGAGGLPSKVNANVASSLQAISGTYGMGSLIPTSDPNIYNLSFQYAHRDTIYYPTARVDWNATEKIRVFLSYGQTKTTNDLTNAPQFPGNLPQDKLTFNSNAHNNRIAGFGLDWVFKPTLVNQFHAGYMHQFDNFDISSVPVDLTSLYRQNWNYGATVLTSPYGNAYPRVPISSFYPLINVVDSLNWQKGSHSFVFGGSYFHEQDHYWNGPGGEPSYTFGLDGQDPASNVINAALASQNTTIQGNARSLYALLAARVSAVNIQVGRPLDPKTGKYKPFGQYNLDEVQQAGGFWAQDRWKLRPNLTLNYGLRWDIYGADHDITGFYSSPKTIADLWGPTPIGVINSPGTLGGVSNPIFQARRYAYNAEKVNPSPAIALAWSPDWTSGILGKLVGKDKTVIRAGYSMRRYAEGAQNVWAYASNSGAFFFQGGSATPANGAFQAGSVTFGDPLPNYVLTPPTYSTSVPASQLWGNTFRAINPNIQMPYVEQWNFGIQRLIGSGSAIEVRYVGNLALHQWLSYNINELNIVENGFLKEFQGAQSNLKINQSNGKGNSFANNGLAGQVPLPIFAGAFGSATSNFTNSTYVNNLLNGAAGSMAQTLLNTRQFYCNLVGTANFAPCQTPTLSTSPGAGYPINFWQVNPYANGNGGVLYLDAAGHSNYHGLQVAFRQRPTHGAQFNVNYTWAHSLGIAAQNGIQGEGNNIYYTQRNFRLNYGPSLFDIRHVVHASGTYDLPFGKGKPFLSQSKLANYTAGGWTLGTIVVIQSGNPAQLSNGFNTLNNTDSGVLLNGVTVADVQNSIGVFRTGNPWINTIDPKFVGANGAANGALLSPNNVAGSFGYRPYVYGPGWYNIDLSVNKSIPIRESLRFTFQAEFLNATNHPTFNIGNLAVQSTSFGQTTSGNAFSAARRIEFRANIEF